MKFFTIASALTLLPAALALPTLNSVLKRQNCAVTCGNTCYYQSDLDNAVSVGYNDYSNGQEQGSSDYPHTYNNYEGFDFPVSGPYQEFPVMENYQTYDGNSSPGPDRVIFNTQGQYAGTITHTGASGNDFVSCQGENIGGS